MDTSKGHQLHQVFGMFSKQLAALCTLVYFVICLLFVPKFASFENVVNILVQSTDLIILACGLTFIFINAGIDFSMTAIIALDSVIAAGVSTHIDNPIIGTILAILAMLLVALFVGCLNGLSVTKLKMPSFIATMATQLVFSGIALTVTQSKSIGGIPDAFNNIAQGKLLGIPVPIYIAAITVLFFNYLLNKTVYGKYVIAVGTNHQTSRISGLPVKKIVFSLFLISSLCAAVACVIMTGRLGAGVPALGKDDMMNIVAAVVLGGTATSGGSGTIIGSMFGALLVVILNNSLNLLGLDWYYITACKGALILLVTLVPHLRKES